MNNGNNIFVPDGKNAIHDGIEHAPGGGKALLDSTDTLFLLLDHQSGLFQNLKDICEVHRTWNRPDAAELAQPYTMVSPNYRAVMESYDKAQAVVRTKVDIAPAAPRRQTVPVGLYPIGGRG